ncbi:MAG: NADH-quinone oxidoreductase subunit N [Myxococcales bacterium]|nr:NADH-quinone oxidoreductase subunit N [Myxococcales bacterium]
MSALFSELLLVAPLLLLIGGGLMIMLIDAFSKEGGDLAGITATTLFVAGAISAVALATGASGEATPVMITRYLSVDGLGLFFDVAICAGAGLSALLAGGYLREHRIERGEFYVVLLFSAAGAIVLARAVDLITIFIGLETMSLGVYSLVAYRRSSARAIEGAVKYFLLGSFAAAILLFGFALLYGATGHTDLVGIGAQIAAGHADPSLVLIAAALVIVGLAFKISAVPFHMWTPDAYEGAATPATTFMSVAVKAAGFAVMLRLLLVSFGDERLANEQMGWPPLLAAIAAVTMLYGNLAALAQKSVKRMLAYSSIAHAGYALVGVTAAFAAPEEGVSSVLFYMLAYTVSNALAFGTLILIGSHGKEAVSYEDLAGVGRRHPLVALPFVIAVLSLMGLPPTAGFFAKYYVLLSAIEVGGGMVWLAVLLVLSSAIGAYYYLRVIVFMFMKEPQPGASVAVPMRSGYVAFALVIAGYFVMKMGITPGFYVELAVDAARSFLS